MTASISLDYALAIARQLSPSDRAHLIARLADDLRTIPSTAVALPPDDLTLVIPVITEGQWDPTIPVNRAELYDDDERC
jgi:hypothetical protein